jgi:hypothetical protein
MSNVALNLDEARMKAAATELKDSPDVVSELSTDPKAFMQRFGVAIDDAAATAIRDRLASAGEAKAASVVHIDL